MNLLLQSQTILEEFPAFSLKNPDLYLHTWHEKLSSLTQIWL